MKNFRSYLQASGKSRSTVEHYMRYTLDFLSFLDKDNTEVENCTAKEVLSYLNHLQKKGLENKTRAVRLNVIKQLFNWQVEQEVRKENPITHVKIKGVKRTKLYQILSPQELEKIFNDYQIPSEDDPRANRNWFNTYRLSKQRNKVLLSLIINQGLTTAEVGRIEMNDLKLREGEVFINGSRKSNERILKLKSNQIMDLMEYTFQIRPQLLEFHEDKGIKDLFLSTPIASRKTVEKNTLGVWKGLSKEVKSNHKKFVNFKQVRASVITKWLKQYNLREVQYMAGHRYVSSTEKYMINQTEDLIEAIDKFHPF